MKTSRIDFAPRSLRRAVAQAHPAIWLAAAIGIALCVSGAVTGYGLAQQSETRLAQLQQLRARASEREQPAQRGAPIGEAQAGAVNDIVARLNLPWRDLFQAVEAATPAGSVALLELAPDASRHAIKGSAEAKTGEDMLDYIARVGQQPFFSSVVLTRHEINEQDPNKPLRFQFLAEWARSEK
jgi:Tfp pilus assembly protein PilN